MRDQLAFIWRCGISLFCLADDGGMELALSVFFEISQSYQPAFEQD
jgi:uncharacterized protein (DUF934 family)